MNIKDIEEGMYVRGCDGSIGKVKKLDTCIVGKQEFDDNRCFLMENGQSHYGFITKASHNIIDILEPGDYVNGVCIEKIYSREDDCLYCDCFQGGIAIKFTNYNIKSIVTKEYFKKGKFEV